MRANIKIFSAAFIIIFAALQVQTLFENYGAKKTSTYTKKVAPTCCMKMKSCAKAPKANASSSPKKNDCGDKGCNPFMPCAIGICCYLVENIITCDFYFTDSHKLAILNDNRLSGNISECWHPPELIS